jgi:hypothetical protein
MSLLEDLFTKYGTDKGIWGYTPAYEKHLEARRESVTSVLEIGICGFRDIPNNVVGASLFAWRDYFPAANIFGLDNDARFIFNDQPRIKTALADAYLPESLSKALYSFSPTDEGAIRFDFICDDAVHDPLQQMYLAYTLWPFLKRGGVYAIEEACPYKCPNNRLDTIVHMLMGTQPDMEVVEYETHKPERLLILTKAA